MEGESHPIYLRQLYTVSTEGRSSHKAALILVLNNVRYMVVGVSSFANIGDCTSTPGGFARLTHSVLQWIQTVKVKNIQGKTQKIRDYFFKLQG